MAAARVSSYIKNVGKSFGYAVGDTVLKYNPTIKSILDTSRDTIKQAQSSIKEYKINSLNSSRSSSLKQQNALTNIIDDLKSGNWYNKQRMDNAGFGDFDFDIDDNDFDIDFGDDWGDDENSSSGSSAREIIEENAASSKRIIKSVGKVGSSISKSMGYASAQSAKYIGATINASTDRILASNTHGFNQVSNILLGMNNTLVGIAELGQPLSEHMQNSVTFFTNTSKTLSNIDENLAKLVARTEFLDPKSKINKNKKGIGSILNGGEFDFSAYMDMVKSNFKETKDMIESFASLGTMMAGKGGKNLSPMAMAMTSALGLLIPKFAKESMKEFNDNLANMLGLGLKRFSSRAAKSANPLVNILGGIFGIKDNYQSSYNTGKYERGPISWDGEAKQSLTKVIPRYLAEIYAAITGTDPQYYDYKTGKYVKGKAIKIEANKEKNIYAQRAGGKFRDDLISDIENNKLSYRNPDRVKQEVESFFLFAFTNNIDLKDIESNLNNGAWLSKAGLSRESADIIKRYIKNAKPGKKFSRLSSFELGIASNRDQYGSSIKEREIKGNDVLSYLNDGFKGGKNTLGVSSLNENSLLQTNYLRGIYNVTANLYTIMLALAKKQDISNIEFNEDFDLSGKELKTEALKSRNIKKKVANAIRNTLTTAEEIATFGMSDEQKEAYIQEKKIKKETEKYGGKIKEWLSNKAKGIKETTKGIKTTWEAPFVAMTNVLNVLTDGITNVFFGKQSFTEYLKQKFLESDLFNAMRDEFRKVKSSTKEWIGSKWYGKDWEHHKWLKQNGKDVEQLEQQIARDEMMDESGFGSGLIKVRKSRRYSGGQSGIQEDYDISKHGMRGVFLDGIGLLGEKIFGIFSSIGNSTDKNATDKAKAQAKKVASEFMNKENKGAVGLGAVTGLGVSLLTGAIVGPLAGAAIGAGVGLASKSQAVQDALFGEGDPNDPNYKKGLLGNLGKAIKEHLPESKAAVVGGLAGTVGGIFMGSPVLGLVLGSSIGFASKSEKFKEYLFGSDEKMGLIPKELQKKIKNAAPNMAAGAIAGLVAGPFGSLTGNIIIGSALGYLSTSEKFKEYIFGEDGKGGIAGLIKEKILSRIEDVFKNFGSMIAGFGKKLVSNTIMHVKNIMEGIKSKFNKLMTETRLGRFLGKVGNAIIKTPINVLGGLTGFTRKGLQKENLRKGYAVYNKGKKLNAAEREELRAQYGMSSSEFDNYISSARSPEELDSLKETLKFVRDGKYASLKKGNEIMSSFYGKMQGVGGGLTGSAINSIGAAIKAKNYDKARKLLIKNAANLDEATVQKYTAIIQTASEEIANNNSYDLSKGALKTLRERGFKINKSNAISYIEAIEAEKESRFKDVVAQREEKVLDDQLDTQKNILETLTNIYMYNKNKDYREFKEKGGTASDFQAYYLNKHSKKKRSKGLDKVNNALTHKEVHAYDNIESSTTDNSEALPVPAGGASALVTDQKKPSFITTMFGTIKMKKGNQGGEVPDTSDKTTAETQAKSKGFFDAVKTVPIINKVTSGISTLTNKIKRGLFGDEDKEGILSKFSIKNILGKALNIIKLIGVGLLGAGVVSRVWKNKTDIVGGVKNIGSSLIGAFQEGGFIHKFFIEKEGFIHKAFINNDSFFHRFVIDPDSPVQKFIGRGIKLFTSLFDKDGTLYKVGKTIGKASEAIFNSLTDKDGLLNKVVNKVADIADLLLSKKWGLPAIVTAIGVGKVANLITGQKGAGGLISAGKGAFNLGKTLLFGSGAGATVAEGGAATSTMSGGLIGGIKALVTAHPMITAAIAAAAGGLALGKFINKKFGGWIYKNITEPVMDFFTKTLPKTFSKIGEFLFNMGKEIVALPINATKNFKDLSKNAFTGKLDKLWKFDTSRNKKGLSGSILNVIGAVQKVVLSPIGAISWGIQKVVSGVIQVGKSIIEIPNKAGQNFTNMLDKAGKGKLDELWNYETATSDSGLSNGVLSVLGVAQKVTLTPIAAISWVFNSIKDVAKDAINSLVGVVKKAVNWIYDKLTELWDSVKSAGKKVAAFFGFKSSSSKSEQAIANEYGSLTSEDEKDAYALEYAKAKFKSAGFDMNNLTEDQRNELIRKGREALDDIVSRKGVHKLNSANRLSHPAASGGASGFVSQLDKKYSNYHIGGNSFASKGCGPSVAAMAASSMGHNMSVSEAVNSSRGYQNPNGVSIDYFTEALGKKGIKTRIISGGGAGDIYNSLAHGKKAVLLGRDPYNTSKAFSPFGPNNHYVLATGLDRSGNIIVNDPELRGPRTYNPSILNSTSYAVAGGDSGIDQKKYIWDTLKARGWTDAGVAGAMGNLETESGNSPKRIEGDYIKSLKTIISSHGGIEGLSIPSSNMDDYVKSLFKVYDRDGVKYTASKYRMDDGHYYPGIGLAGWTAGRTKGLIDFARGQGLDPYSLEAQLMYMNKELNERGSLDSEMKSISNVESAAKLFAKNFEGNTINGQSDRVSHAKTIYGVYTGTPASDFSLAATQIPAAIAYEPKIVNGKFEGKYDQGASGKQFQTDDVSSSTPNDSYLSMYNPNLTPAQQYLLDAWNSVHGITYSQASGKQDMDMGTSSCAAGVGWAYRKALGINGFSPSCDYAAKDNRFQTIYVNGGSNPIDTSKLNVGDILFYNEKGTSHASNINNGWYGHADMYAGDNHVWTMGYTNGPHYDNIGSTKRSRIMLAKRYKGFIGDSSFNPGVIDYSSSSSNLTSSGSTSGGKGILGLLSKLGSIFTDAFAKIFGLSSTNNTSTATPTPIVGTTVKAQDYSNYDYGDLTGDELTLAKIYTGETGNFNSQWQAALEAKFTKEQLDHIREVAKNAKYGLFNDYKNLSPMKKTTSTTTTNSIFDTNTSNLTKPTATTSLNNQTSVLSLKDYENYKSGSGSGLTGPYARVLNSFNSGSTTRVNTKKYRSLHHITGGGSGLTDYEITSMLNTVKNDPALSNGMVSKELVANLIEVITRLLSNVADNTAPIEKIYQALVTYMSKTPVPTGGSSDLPKVVKVPTPQVNSSNNIDKSNDIDSNVRNLVGVLAQLAKG